LCTIKQISTISDASSTRRRENIPQESIIDDTKPNAGRMYDYYLGANHNFEVDRQAAEQVIQLLPFAPKGARLQRWALQDIAAFHN
jgi:hypothetical protein